MTKEWAQVSCQVPSEMVDAVAEYLIGLSGGGVGIDNLVLDTFSLDTLEESPVKTVTAYFPADESIGDRLREIEAYLTENGPSFAGFVYREPTVSTITEQDWSTSWKEHFKPLRIGRRLVVKPTWEDFRPKRKTWCWSSIPAWLSAPVPIRRPCSASLSWKGSSRGRAAHA